MPPKVYSAKSPLGNPAQFLRELLISLWEGRELVWNIFVRDLKAQFRESYFGYVWLLAPPVITMLVWVFLNSQKIVVVETNLPYPVFVLVGTTAWASFSSTVLSPLSSFNASKNILMKLNVPPESFIMAGFLRSVFDMLIRIVVLLPVFLFFKIVPPVEALLFPVAIVCLLALGFCVGLTLVPIGSLYGDVLNALGSFIGLLMYTAPVVFPVPPGGGILAQAMEFNPLTPTISLCRDLLTTGELTHLAPSLIVLGFSVVITIFSFGFLRVAMPHLVSRMGM